MPFLGHLFTWQQKFIYIFQKYMLSRFQNIFYFFRGMKFDRVLIFSKYFPLTFLMKLGVLLTKISVLEKSAPGSAKKYFSQIFFFRCLVWYQWGLTNNVFLKNFGKKSFQTIFSQKSEKCQIFPKIKSEIKKSWILGKKSELGHFLSYRKIKICFGIVRTSALTLSL